MTYEAEETYGSRALRARRRGGGPELRADQGPVGGGGAGGTGGLPAAGRPLFRHDRGEGRGPAGDGPDRPGGGGAAPPHGSPDHGRNLRGGRVGDQSPRRGVGRGAA